MEKFEIVPDEATGEVKAVKYGGKEYTPEEWQRTLEREKNLQEGYSKKFNELDAKEKELAEDIDTARKLEALIEQHPEAEAEILKVFEKHTKGAGAAGDDGKLSDKALQKIDALEQRLEEKEKKEQLEKAMKHYDGRITDSLNEVGIKSAKAAKAIYDTTYSWLLTQKETPSNDAIKEYIKGCVEDFKADILPKKPVVPPPKSGIPGKGGQGGASSGEDKYVKPGSPEHNKLKAEAMQEFLRKQRGEGT